MKIFSSIMQKLEQSNQLISQSISLIETKIAEVNQRLDDTVVNNTPVKNNKTQEQEDPRVVVIQNKLMKIHKKIANKKTKIENAKSKITELEVRDGRDMV